MNKGPKKSLESCPMGHGKPNSPTNKTEEICPMGHSHFLQNPAAVSEQVLAVRSIRKTLGLPDRKAQLGEAVRWFANDENLKGSIEDIEAEWEPKFRASALSAYWLPELKAFITKAHKTKTLIPQKIACDISIESMEETDPIISLLRLKESLTAQLSASVIQWRDDQLSSGRRTDLDHKRLLLNDRALRDYWQGKVIEVEDERLGKGDLVCSDLVVGMGTFVAALMAELSSEIMTIPDRENVLTVEMIQEILEQSLDNIYSTLFDFTGFSAMRDQTVIPFLNFKSGESMLDKEFRTRVFKKLEGRESEAFAMEKAQSLETHKINEETGCPMRFLLNPETKEPVLLELYKDVLIPLVMNLWAKSRYE